MNNQKFSSRMLAPPPAGRNDSLAPPCRIIR